MTTKITLDDSTRIDLDRLREELRILYNCHARIDRLVNGRKARKRRKAITTNSSSKGNAKAPSKATPGYRQMEIDPNRKYYEPHKSDIYGLGRFENYDNFQQIEAHIRSMLAVGQFSGSYKQALRQWLHDAMQYHSVMPIDTGFLNEVSPPEAGQEELDY